MRDATGAFSCLDRLTAARAELLRKGFAPANDTPSWLRVSATVDGGLLLQVYTVYSPDGDGLRTYDAEVHPSRGASRPWRLEARKVLDEFEEERLPERTWTRRRNGWTAIVHTRSDEPKWVTSFERVARPALDACLAHRR